MARLWCDKTILCSGNVFLDSDKSLFFMMATFLVTYSYDSNIIISEPLKYSVFHNRDTSIKISHLQQSFPIWLLSVFYN